VSEGRPGRTLRIAVLGDFEGLHTRRWLEVFVQRGHDVHAISYYHPAVDLPGVTVHVLSEAERRSAPGAAAGDTDPAPFSHGESARLSGSKSTRLRALVPPAFQRLVHARRYARAGLRRVLDEVQPEVFHAHYAVEHGFYGAFAGFHPYVVSAWGSDLLVESHKTFGRLIAGQALSRADLVTANDLSLTRRAAELGVPAGRIAVIHLGIDSVFLDAGKRSVNLRPAGDQPPTVVSDRALEPLYNVDVVIRAFAGLRERVPTARLIVAGDGSERGRLEALARQLAPEASVRFAGRLETDALAETLAGAHVYVSVPSSDSLALSTVEAMAAGCFPVMSDLPSNEGWLTHRRNALLVPARDHTLLANALYESLSDHTLRREAVGPNRAKAETEGLRERNMLLMERHYYRLAGHPQAGKGEAI
jgi:L-malate glycosyltransferase